MEADVQELASLSLKARTGRLQQLAKEMHLRAIIMSYSSL